MTTKVASSKIYKTINFFAYFVIEFEYRLLKQRKISTNYEYYYCTNSINI